MEYSTAIIVFISYIVGCFPSASLFVRLLGGKDILKEGTGNPGAVNSWEVTGKKLIGLLVLAADAAKGALAVFLAWWLFGATVQMCLVAGTLSVLGHNFNIFHKFRGGRGLATAFGAFMIISPVVPIAWLVLYYSIYLAIKRDVHWASLFATGLIPAVYSVLPHGLQRLPYDLLSADTNAVAIGCSAVATLIVLKHIRPIIDKFNHPSEQ